MLRHLNTIFNALIVVVAIAAGGTLLWRLYFLPAGERALVETVSRLGIPAENVTHVRGNGRLALVEFSDFECTFCARHARTAARQIDTQLVNTGRIRHVFLKFPLPNHPRAQKASEAAACAAKQGRFWEMHDRLFENSATLEHDDLVRRAGGLGVDLGRFTECLKSGETRADVLREAEVGRRLGVRATPTFFVGTVEQNGAITFLRRINGAVAFAHFKSVVDELESNLSVER